MLVGSLAYHKSTTWDWHTSPPKDVLLQICYHLKNPLSSAGLEPANFGSSDKHATTWPLRAISHIVTLVHGLPDVICEECFRLCMKRHIHILKNVFNCARTAIYTMSFIFSLFPNWYPHNASLSNPRICWSNLVRSRLYAGWGRSLNFSLWNVLMITPALCGSPLSWCKTTTFVSFCLHLLWIAVLFKRHTIPCSIVTLLLLSLVIWMLA